MQVKRFLCSDCDKAFFAKKDMETHTRTHSGVKPYACKFPECGATFADISNMYSHYRAMHSKEGARKQISKQERLHKILKDKWAVDQECHIRYQGGCVPDPDKFCARVDFHVLGITGVSVLVESERSVPAQLSRLRSELRADTHGADSRRHHGGA
jgi:uncharacterized Zn-finger protein